MKEANERNAKGIQEWEKLYIHALVQELKPQGDVLLIGFNHPESAVQIDTHHPKSLTIIEADPEAAKLAQKWAADKKNVKVIQGNWKKELNHLDAFDAVLFDERTNASNLELIHRLSPDLAKNIASTSQGLLAAVKEKLASIKKKFSDEEMNNFYEQLGQNHISDLVPFLKNLRENENITSTQFDAIMKKIHAKRANEHKNEVNSHDGEEETLYEEEDSFLVFVETAYKKHLRKGSRVTTFLTNGNSKYEDPIFFDRIATNSNLTYHEKVAKIHVPEIKVEDALVILIQKS